MIIKMCLYPKIIKNPRYKNDTTGLRDTRTLYVPIQCNNCIECYKKKGRDWKIRLGEEIKNKENGRGYFVTLTFSTDSLMEIDSKIPDNLDGYTRDNAIAAYAVRHWLERWRKKYKKSLRHWLVTELGHGKTEHMHIHGIVWTKEDWHDIQNTWKYGWASPNEYDIKDNRVNNETIGYIIKYITKQDKEHKYFRPIVLCSSGIGNNYKPSAYEIKNDIYKSSTGHEMSMPQYYRNKIYDDEERENRWVDKLNKPKRWVARREIDSWEIELISKILKEGQELSERKGFIGGNLDWKQHEYERAQRNLLRTVRYKERKNNKIEILNLVIPDIGNTFEGKFFIQT